MTEAYESSSVEAAGEAARLFERLGYVSLALCAPGAAAISTATMLGFFAAGLAFLLVSAALEPEIGMYERWRSLSRSPLALACLALWGWAAISLAWSPYQNAGVLQLATVGGAALATGLALICGREHMRATDIYAFPVGVVFGLAIVAALALARGQGYASAPERTAQCGMAAAMMLFPAMAGLAARGRNGLARLLMILTLAVTFAIGAPATATAILAGITALSFAISDLRRTTIDFSVLAAALILLAPLVPAVSPALGHWLFHAKLSAMGDPFPALGVAADFVLHEPARLLTGRGVATIAQGVEGGALSAATPRVALFQVWFELGVVGAAIAAAAAWLAYRGLAAVGPKTAPYLAAALTCDLTLAFLAEDFSQLWWVIALGVSAIGVVAATRSQYRTSRPSAVSLSHL